MIDRKQIKLIMVHLRRKIHFKRPVEMDGNSMMMDYRSIDGISD